MKLYDKKPLYISENGIFKRTTRSLYTITEEGKIVGAVVSAGLLLLVVLAFIL